MQLRNRKCEINFFPIIIPSIHSNYVPHKSNKSKYDNAGKLKIRIQYSNKIFKIFKFLYIPDSSNLSKCN